MKTLNNISQESLALQKPHIGVGKTPKPKIGDDDGISNRAMNWMILVFTLVTIGVALAASASATENVKYRILIRQAMLDMDRLEYEKAIPKLLEVVANTDENANVSQMLGVCYLYGRNAPEKAVFYLSRAASHVSEDFLSWDLDELNAPMNTLYHLGKAYELLGEFSKASEYYNEYLAHLSTKKGIERSRMYAMIQKTTQSCQLAAEQAGDKTKVIENVVLNK